MLAFSFIFLGLYSLIPSGLSGAEKEEIVTGERARSLITSENKGNSLEEIKDNIANYVVQHGNIYSPVKLDDAVCIVTSTLEHFSQKYEKAEWTSSFRRNLYLYILEELNNKKNMNTILRCLMVQAVENCASKFENFGLKINSSVHNLLKILKTRKDPFCHTLLSSKSIDPVSEFLKNHKIMNAPGLVTNTSFGGIKKKNYASPMTEYKPTLHAKYTRKLNPSTCDYFNQDYIVERDIIQSLVRRKLKIFNEEPVAHISDFIISLIKLKNKEISEREDVLNYPTTLYEILDVFVEDYIYHSFENTTYPSIYLPYSIKLLLQDTFIGKINSFNPMPIVKLSDLISLIKAENSNTEKFILQNWIKDYTKYILAEDNSLNSLEHDEITIPDISFLVNALERRTIDLISSRLKHFNHSDEFGIFPTQKIAIPPWVMEAIEMKAQKYLNKSLIFPIKIEWNIVPSWIIEYINIKVHQNYQENTLLEYCVMPIEFIDFAIWYTDKILNMKSSKIKYTVMWEDLPDWLVDFFSTQEMWRRMKIIYTKRCTTIGELVDWSMVFNVRSKWGLDGERSLMFKNKFGGLTEFDKNAILEILKICDRKLPSKDFKIPLVRLPKSALMYIEQLLCDTICRNPDKKHMLTLKRLPNWLMELVQTSIDDLVDFRSALSKSWSIYEIFQWAVWMVKLKSYNGCWDKKMRDVDIPDWTIQLFQTFFSSKFGGQPVKNCPITTENILQWAIGKQIQEEEIFPIETEKKTFKISSNTIWRPLHRKIDEINQNKVASSVTLPLNQLPLWLLNMIDLKLKQNDKFDRKIIPFGVIELLQSLISKYRVLKNYVDKEFKKNEIVETALILQKQRKKNFGLNDKLNLIDIPWWLITILNGKSGSHISIEEIIEIMLKNESLQENVNIEDFTLSLFKNIVTNLNNILEFLPIKYKLQKWMDKFIEDKMDVVCEAEFGTQPMKNGKRYPTWLKIIYNIHIRENNKNDKNNSMTWIATLNKSLKTSLWLLNIEQNCSMISFIDLPHWIVDIFKTELTGRQSILKYPITLDTFLHLGIRITMEKVIERDYTKIMEEIPGWVKLLLQKKIKLLNEKDIQFVNSPPSGSVSDFIIRKMKEIYKSDSELTKKIILETTPEWIKKYLELKLNNNESIDTIMNDSVLFSEVIDYGLWISKNMFNLKDFKLFDIPYWLIELIKDELKFSSDEDKLLKANLKLEDLLVMGINTSVARKTYKESILAPQFINQTPQWIKDLLEMEISKYNEQPSHISFTTPKNQLPIWAVQKIKNIVQLKFEEIRKDEPRFIWKFVPYWSMQLMQSIIQKYGGYINSTEQKESITDIIQWAIWIIDNKKNDLEIKNNVTLNDMPNWLIDFLEGKTTNSLSKVKVISIIVWAIEKEVSSINDDSTTYIQFFKITGDLPEHLYNFIISEINEVNIGRGINKFNVIDQLSQRYIFILRDAIIAMHERNSPIEPFLMEEMVTSWMVDYIKFLYHQSNSEFDIKTYKAPIKEIIGFVILHSYLLLNKYNLLVNRPIDFADLPEWLISFIIEEVRTKKDAELSLNHTVSMQKLLKWSLLNSRPIQVVRYEDYNVIDFNSQHLALPVSVNNCIQKQIEKVNSVVKQFDHTQSHYLSMFTSNSISKIVQNLYRQITGNEPKNTWEFLPFLVIKLIQYISYEHIWEKDIINVEISAEQLIEWLLKLLQHTKARLIMVNELGWADIPPWMIRLLRRICDKTNSRTGNVRIRNIVENVVKDMITTSIRREDKTEAQKILPGVPNDLIDEILNITDTVNTIKYEAVNLYPISKSKSFAMKEVERIALKMSGNKPVLKLLIEKEAGHSITVNYFKEKEKEFNHESDFLRHKLNMREVIEIIVMQIKKVYGKDRSPYVRLLDLPYWLINFIHMKCKSLKNSDEFLNSTMTIEDILQWSLTNNPILQSILLNGMYEPFVSRNSHNTSLGLLDKLVIVLTANLNKTNDNSGLSKNHLPIWMIIHIEKTVKNKLGQLPVVKPKNTWEAVPYWLLKFIYMMLYRYKGSRDILELNLSIKELIEWFIEWNKSFKMNNTKVSSWNDFRKCLSDLLIRSEGNHLIKIYFNINFIIEEGIECSIHELFISKGRKIIKSKFKNITKNTIYEVNKIIENIIYDVPEYYYPNICEDIPNWAMSLFESSVKYIFGCKNELVPIITWKVIPHCMVEFIKTLKPYIVREQSIFNTVIPLPAIIYFTAKCTHSLYNIEKPSDERDIILLDLPVWLLGMVESIVFEDHITYNITLKEFVLKAINFSTGAKTLAAEDLELPNNNEELKIVSDSVKSYLIAAIDEYSRDKELNEYRKPKNQLPIWAVDYLDGVIKRSPKKFYQVKHTRKNWVSTPNWIIEVMQMMLQRCNGTMDLMAIKIDIRELVRFVILRTENLKIHLGVGSKLELHEVPLWIVKFLEEMEENTDDDFHETGVNITLPDFVKWGINYAFEFQQEMADMAMLSSEVERLPNEVINFVRIKILEDNMNRTLFQSNVSEITVQNWMEKFLNNTYCCGINCGYLNAIPHWLILFIKIKLQEHGISQCIMNVKVNITEIIKYAIWLTKERYGSMNKIRIVDLPIWLMDLLVTKNGNVIDSDTLLLYQDMKMSDLIKWAIRNDASRMPLGKRTQKVDFDTIPEWIQCILIDRVNHDERKNNFNTSIMGLPVISFVHIRKCIKQVYEFFHEPEPDTLLKTFHIWEVKLIDIMTKENLTVDKIIDWSIWIANDTINGSKLTVNEIPQWTIDLLEKVGDNKSNINDILSKEITQDLLIKIILFNRVKEQVESLDLLNTHQILREASTRNFILDVVKNYNSRNQQDKSYPNLTELPQLPPWAIDNLKSIIGDSDPSLTEKPLPFWLNILIKYKIQHIDTDKSVFNESVILKDILEFVFFDTKMSISKDMKDLNHYIRVIELPFSFIELVKDLSPFYYDANQLLNHKIGMEELIKSSLNNSILRALNIKGVELKLGESINDDVPKWLRDIFEMKMININEEYCENEITMQGNDLPFFVVEQIKEIMINVSTLLGLPSQRINVPHWLIELIKVKLQRHGRVVDVMDAFITIETIVNWSVCTLKQNQFQMGKEYNINLSQLPRWLICLILGIKGYIYPARVMQHRVTFYEIFLNSVEVSVEDKKDRKIMPSWVERLLHSFIEEINNSEYSEKFKPTSDHLPSWIQELIIKKIVRHYKNAPGALPRISWSTVPQWLVEFLKVKASMEDNRSILQKLEVTHKEFLTFVFWFAQTHSVKRHHLTINDVPDWVPKYINMKVLKNSKSEKSFDDKIKIYEIMDWAIWIAVKKELVRKRLLRSYSHRGLPFWLTHYLQKKVEENNNYFNPKKFFMPNNNLSSEVVNLIRVTLKELYEENPDVLSSLYWSTVPYWIIELLQHKMQENENILGVNQMNIKIDSLVDWGIWITQMKYDNLGSYKNLSLDDLPHWISELLLMKIEGNVRERQITEHEITIDVLMLWAMRNNMEKMRELSYVHIDHELEEVLPSSPNFLRKDSIFYYLLPDQREHFKVFSYNKTIIPEWLVVILHMKLQYANSNCLRKNFHPISSPLPRWVYELINGIILKEFDNKFRRGIYTSTLAENILPHWLKDFLNIKLKELGKNRKTLNHTVSLDEILDYAIWRSHWKRGNSHKLSLKHVPEWSIKFIKYKVKNGIKKDMVTLKELTEFGIIMCMNMELYKSLANYTYETERNLSDWLTEYFEQGKDLMSMNFEVIPKWMLDIVKAELDQGNSYLNIIKELILKIYYEKWNHGMLDFDRLKAALLEALSITHLAVQNLRTVVITWKPQPCHSSFQQFSEDEFTILPIENEAVDLNMDYKLKKVLLHVLDYGDSSLHNMMGAIEDWVLPHKMKTTCRGAFCKYTKDITRQKQERLKISHTIGIMGEEVPYPSTNYSNQVKDILTQMFDVFLHANDIFRQRIRDW